MNKVNHLEKISTIIKDIRTCMFSTMTDNGEMRARPMATAKYDDLGNIWFFTDRESAKLDELNNKQPILISYADPSSNTYLSLTGKAYEIDDLVKKKEYFNIFTQAWFPDGPESKDLTLIKFEPSIGEYWDSSNSNIVQLYKIGKAILSKSEYESNSSDHARIRLK